MHWWSGPLDYGVVREAGAAAFILANGVAGWAAGMAGSPFALLGMHAELFGLAALLLAAGRSMPPRAVAGFG